MFSLNEIWKCVLARLVDLNVLRDPDADSANTDDDESDELEDNFDFVLHGRERVGKLFNSKRSKDQKERALRDIMPKNDFNVVNRMLCKCIEHEKSFIKLNS